MLTRVYQIVTDAALGALDVFRRIYEAIPGSVEALVVMFFVAVVVSLLIMPLRGGTPITGSASDEVRVTETKTLNHNTGKWNHTTSYSKTERRKR